MAQRIDKRISYRIVLDTEACPIDKEYDKVDGNNMFAYDFGWTVCDKHGNIYERRSFINADIFLDEQECMQSAYYADKIPEYWNKIKDGRATMKSLYNIRKAFLEDVEKYEVEEVYAYNMWFDYKTTNRTMAWVTKSKYRHFFPKDMKVCDIMKMAQDVVAKTPTYIRFCQDNGFMTAHKTPRPQLKAETVYRYIKQDTDFIESHTALEDAEIETAIMAYCFAKHKKMTREIF